MEERGIGLPREDQDERRGPQAEGRPPERAVEGQGIERFYEIGPGRVLAGLLKRVNRKVDCRNVTA